ncbi:Hsp20/alpha crystallin family protein [Garciella nitratireducens]|uniref:HSP20 family protein n=1 Tax=Garciella nitratireducens DSM 15102 TaxID=1121911 RepID=A0A1T4L4X5_9FIRM|nr:Hsp20/alpha crystallin family protein [Garciella nitratireducens]SJZ49769.1 HSP20 family protein [Garciella nitratireducens DSM 15102]
MALVPFNRRRGNMPSNFFDGFFNMLDEFFSDNWLAYPNFKGNNFRVNIQENEKEYVVEAELPGINKDEINLEFNDGRLTILVKREDTINEEKKNYIHKESYYSSMSRSVYLPDAKQEGAKAKLDNGILTIIVPKDKNSNSKRIDIQ